jgi:hypothetical protein
MSTIKFTTPLTKYESKNPWVFDKKYFDEIPPNTAGAYIVGVKIPVNGQGEKFCPLYVGIRDNLKKRIIGHRKSNNSAGELNTNKELFDFIDFQPAQFYDDIKKFDEIYIRSNLTRSSEHKKKVFNIISNKPFNNSLIWFPDSDFFDNYLKVNSSTFGIPGKKNNGHKKSINDSEDLDTISTLNASKLKNKIEKIKSNIEDKFYFSYVTIDAIIEYILSDKNHFYYASAIKYKEKPLYVENGKNAEGKTICEDVEASIKNQLQNIGISTYAKAKKNSNGTYNLDFPTFSTILVNMTSIPFKNSQII